MDTKSLGRVQVKDADRGEVQAVFSTLNTVDHDGDYTLPGAFQEGAPVRISAYGHQSWDGALPVGKGVIRVNGDDVILDGQFFMNTTAGRDTFEVVKQLGDLQEWSYGYDVVDAEPGYVDERPVRMLKRLKVHEASPVMLGAGIGTRTLGVKGIELKGAVSVHHTETTTAAWDASKVVAAIPDDASVSGLKSVFAWVPNGSDITKSGCKFPHHQGVGGAANLRACTAGIAVLNGGRGGADIPEADRQGVYRHLAAHLRDADREPPELRSAPGGSLKFHEEAALVMASVSGLLDRASEVVALRAAKGKDIAASSAELLLWVDDDLTRLKSLLNTPGSEPTGSSLDDATREYLRFLARKL